MSIPRSFDIDRLTRPEAAQYLGVSVNTLESWACYGRYDLPFVRIGRRVFYRRTDLDRFIDRRTIRGTG